VQQVYGTHLDGIKTLDSRSAFIICWTQDGCIDKTQRSYRTGGTGQAIAAATWFSHITIPVFNLFYKDHYEKAIMYAVKVTSEKVNV
jgi:hypothetical protein